MNGVADELKRAFDHVGLDGKLSDLGQEASEDGFMLHRFSFWVPEAYTFDPPAPASEWLHADEVSPQDGTEVLVWLRDPGHITVIFYTEDFGYVFHGPQKPTHWMPLPEGPPDDKTS